MAQLGGSIDETFDARAPVDTVRAWFLDLDRIAAATEEIERHEKLGDGVLHYVLKEQAQAGYSFRPDYRVRYHAEGDDVVWEPVQPSNLQNRGRASFTATATGTKVRFQQEIAMDIAAPGFVMKLLTPIIDRILRPSMRRFVERMIKV